MRKEFLNLRRTEETQYSMRVEYRNLAVIVKLNYISITFNWLGGGV